LKVKFQADADLRGPIVHGLIRLEPMIDFKVSTMRRHFERFIETRNSPGVVMVPQRLPYHEAIDRLLRLWATTEAERWKNVLFYLPR
jgi:hypothetical protein